MKEQINEIIKEIEEKIKICESAHKENIYLLPLQQKSSLLQILSKLKKLI